MSRLLSVLCLVLSWASVRADSGWIEGFEAGFPPDGWTTNSVDQISTYAFSGSYSARLNAAGDYLITPEIINRKTLIFWTYTTAADPAIIVEYSADKNGPWQETAESPFSGYTEQWNGQAVDLSFLSRGYIRFRKSGSGTLYIDDVSVSGELPSDQPPVISPPGNQTVYEHQPLSFTVSASDPADQDPVTLTATGLPPGAVFTNSFFIWNPVGPPGNYAPVFYASDKDGSVSLTVFITVVPRPQLLISEIADPSGTGGDAYRFVELYNAGTDTIDLAANGWTLSKQVNGGTWYDIPLAGTVAADSVWVIACNADDFQDAYGFPPDQSSGTVSGNGDDAYFLYCGGNHTRGVLVDLYGETDTDGTGTAWVYEDSRAVRKNHILFPSPLWSSSEWIITPGAQPEDMTPGRHGPVPEFNGLESPFVFLGDDLNLTVTAVNTVRTDTITLSASALPSGAVFTPATGTGKAVSYLKWSRPSAGVYEASFSAAGLAGTAAASVSITVAAHSQIHGKFYGWNGDTIFKLVNGQFWQQSAPGSKTVSPALYRPVVTITNILGQRRLFTSGCTGYAVVTPLSITESTVTNDFTGLRHGNVYQLSDKTAWHQISFENIPSSERPVSVWRWIKDDRQILRFIDRNDTVIGTCAAEPVIPVPATKTHSMIDGSFNGFGYGNIFRLIDGSWLKQISFERSASVLHRPEAFLWSTNGMDYLELPAENMSVTVEKLNVLIESTVTNTFTGLHYGNLYRIENAGDWLQVSFENISTSLSNPSAMLWIENSRTNMLIRDSRGNVIGKCTVTDTNIQAGHDGGIRTADLQAGADAPQSGLVVQQTGSAVLNWTAEEGRIYTIEWAPSLAEPFHPLANIPAPQNIWTDTVHTAGTRGFYRIRVRQEE